MEMGVPGLPAPSIGIEAEIAALKKELLNLSDIFRYRVFEKRNFKIYKAIPQYGY
jgi:hypothetical protein